MLIFKIYLFNPTRIDYKKPLNKGDLTMFKKLLIALVAALFIKPSIGFSQDVNAYYGKKLILSQDFVESLTDAQKNYLEDELHVQLWGDQEIFEAPETTGNNTWEFFDLDDMESEVMNASIVPTHPL